MIGMMKSIADFILERFGYVTRDRTIAGQVHFFENQPHVDLRLPDGRAVSGYVVPPVGEVDARQ